MSRNASEHPRPRHRRRRALPAAAAALALATGAAALLTTQSASARPEHTASSAVSQEQARGRAPAQAQKHLTAADAPDLGPNVDVFDPSMSKDEIQSRLDAVFKEQEKNQFGQERHALLFKPGKYDVDANIGFYTQIAGLGLSPDDTDINGDVHAEADWFDDNATQNFWRGAENMAVTPANGTDRWAVSQAAPFRRMHVKGNLQLDPRNHGWSSGGLLADTKVDGTVSSGSQQQYLSRNTEWSGWNGSNWNMVFVGAKNPPAGDFPDPPYTTVDKTPKSREKPFLYVDDQGAYKVFVPDVATETQGTTWSGGTPKGTSLPLDDFFIAKPGVRASELNSALDQGKHLLFTPGVYHLDDTVEVTKPDTVVLGLGLATLVPDGGVTALSVADVDGAKVAGLLIDAGKESSDPLMEMGRMGASADHSADPSSLHDVYFRVGGAGVGKAAKSLVVNSSDVIGDHTWIWRADHGDGVGWTQNTADNGLIVNGDDVTMYGLFVEHFQKDQVVWNGNGGRTYFFQNEMPYDPPDQAAWMDGNTKGYAAYKVADGVTDHQAYGLGSYCYFNVNKSVAADRAFQVPRADGVRFHHMVGVSLGGTGTIQHVINDQGGPANADNQEAYVVNYP